MKSLIALILLAMTFVSADYVIYDEPLPTDNRNYFGEFGKWGSADVIYSFSGLPGTTGTYSQRTGLYNPGGIFWKSATTVDLSTYANLEFDIKSTTTALVVKVESGSTFCEKTIALSNPGVNATFEHISLNVASFTDPSSCGNGTGVNLSALTVPFGLHFIGTPGPNEFFIDAVKYTNQTSTVQTLQILPQGPQIQATKSIWTHHTNFFSTTYGYYVFPSTSYGIYSVVNNYGIYLNAAHSFANTEYASFDPIAAQCGNYQLTGVACWNSHPIAPGFAYFGNYYGDGYDFSAYTKLNFAVKGGEGLQNSFVIRFQDQSGHVAEVPVSSMGPALSNTTVNSYQVQLSQFAGVDFSDIKYFGIRYTATNAATTLYFQSAILSN